jgi:alkanesulfonate monooxygenase
VTTVRAAAARHGRQDQISFSLSLRPILGRTEQEAWAKAERILETAKNLRSSHPWVAFRNAGAPQNVGSQRLLVAAE